MTADEEMKECIEAWRAKGAQIGDNVKLIGRLDGLNPHLVTVGDNCVIGQRSVLLTHCAVKGGRPVIIEGEVWIGFGAIVLPGVRVGRQSVIGAGSVVTKDVPAGSVAAGNPARVIRPLSDEERQRLSQQLRDGVRIGQDFEVLYWARSV